MKTRKEAYEEWINSIKCRRCGHNYEKHSYDSDCEAWTCNVGDEKCEKDYTIDYGKEQSLFEKYPNLEAAFNEGFDEGYHQANVEDGSGFDV